MKSKCFCVRCGYLGVRLWKLRSSSSTQKLYPCIPPLRTEGTSRQEPAEWKITSCQDLDLMAFWAQLLGRLGTVPRGMCHRPTAWAGPMGDGWGSQLREPVLSSHMLPFHWWLLPLCPGVLPVFAFSFAFCPLFVLRTFCVIAGYPVIPLGKAALCRQPVPGCFWPIIFLRRKMGNVSDTGGVLWAWLPEPCALHPSFLSRTIDLINVTQGQVSC